ncbi:hypothetical protein LIER_34264 [Lithospermum erythrorhizon]|uniref:Uncharacterized protein n=1 Tax=Lithospermum erythrorhizon TaxID=34254 RepID=A0AAV3S3E9_LITER
MSVVVYYSKLKRLWDEFNELEPPSVCKCIAGCPCNVTQDFLKKEQRKKLMQFLIELNEKYDAIKYKILTMEPGLQSFVDKKVVKK